MTPNLGDLGRGARRVYVGFFIFACFFGPVAVMATIEDWIYGQWEDYLAGQGTWGHVGLAVAAAVLAALPAAALILQRGRLFWGPLANAAWVLGLFFIVLPGTVGKQPTASSIAEAHDFDRAAGAFRPLGSILAVLLIAGCGAIAAGRTPPMTRRQRRIIAQKGLNPRVKKRS